MARWWCGANMKPKPTASMHSATASGSRSMRAPSASRRSAEPERPVALRLPCLATTQPAPAATKAAVVDTLKVARPPPVPAVSSRSERPTETERASERMVCARPTSSSTVSPFVRRAIRNAAACASDASPAITSRSTAADSSELRSEPEARRSIASVRTGLGKEVRQHGLAVRREHGLRVELHALGRERAVADRHDGRARARRDLERVGQVWVHDERVVAAGHERGFEAAEDRPAVVLHLSRLAVHRLAAHDAPPERLRPRLVAEADAQHRNARQRESGDRLYRHTGLRRRAGAGRDDGAI